MANDMKNYTEVMKKYNEELEVINKSLKGTRKTICETKVPADIPSVNRREELFVIIKELYTFAKKVLEVTPPVLACTTFTSDDKNLEDLIRKQLTDVLPGLLQNALQEQTPVEKVEKKEAVRKPATQHTLLVEKISDNDEEKITDKEWVTVTRKDVKKKLKDVPVVKAAASNGTAKLLFDTKEDLDKATDALKGQYKVTSKSEEKKKLNPKLTVSDIHVDVVDAEMLRKEILLKNERIRALEAAGDVFKVVFFDKDNRFAVLQVSPRMREVIRANRDRISIDLEYHSVKDRIHVIQCYHCQEYGHMRDSDYCKQKGQDATCFYCAGKHTSKDCRNKGDKKENRIKCSNCAKSKNKSERDACGTHKASDTLCPFFIRERVRIMSRTAGCEETKNAYLKRIRELRQKFGRV